MPKTPDTLTANAGAIYIAYGQAAIAQAAVAHRSLLAWHPEMVVTFLMDRDDMLEIEECLRGQAGDWGVRFEGSEYKGARDIKVSLYDLSPYEYTLYLDADTQVRSSIQVFFDLLEDGFDMVITPSGNQGADSFWHVSADEREQTIAECGYAPLQLQCGVMAWKRNERVKAFFDCWQAEWQRWRGQDQAAFVRALAVCPLRVWLLGFPFNSGSGSVITHEFGKLRVNG